RLERTYGEGESGEVALAHRRGAAVDLSVLDLAAVGIVGPAFAGRHDVAVRVQRDRLARSIAPPHDQVGDRLQSAGLDLALGHRMLFGFEAEGLQQFGRAFGVRCVVARGRVGRHANQLLQEAHFLVEMRVDPFVQLFVVGHFVSPARSSSSCWKASTASWMSSLVVLSSGLWLIPEFWPRTNSIACGMTSCSFIASWPAPLGMRCSGTPSAWTARSQRCCHWLALGAAAARMVSSTWWRTPRRSQIARSSARTSAASASRCASVGARRSR